MSFEESPWEREDREIHEAFRAKDAEIARLTRIVAIQKEALERWADAEGDRSLLITELADALEEQDPGYDRYKTLIQRARKATE
jgi:hypothetical protein